jgi:hypothetical protein
MRESHMVGNGMFLSNSIGKTSYVNLYSRKYSFHTTNWTKQERLCSYNVTPRGVRATIVEVEKQ